MFGENTLAGPGYTVTVPPGFTFAGGMPQLGIYRLLAPGGSPLFIEAILQIRPVPPLELPGLLQNFQFCDNPWVAAKNAANLGLAQVLGVLPQRQLPLPQGPATLREFDALNPIGMPLRVMALVLQGPQSAVEVIIMMNLLRWTAFVGPCLTLVSQITLAGLPPQQPACVQAVVDPARKDQIEYQLVAAGRDPVPITALPTIVGGTVIINTGTIIQTGNINGNGIAVGTHSTATVTEQTSTIPTP